MIRQKIITHLVYFLVSCGLFFHCDLDNKFVIAMIVETSEQSPPLQEEVRFLPNYLPDQCNKTVVAMKAEKSERAAAPPPLPKQVMLIPSYLPDQQKRMTIYDKFLTTISPGNFRGFLLNKFRQYSIRFNPQEIPGNKIENSQSFLQDAPREIERKNEITPEIHKQLIYMYTIYCSEMKKPISVIDFNTHHLSAYLAYKGIRFDPRVLPNDVVDAFLDKMGKEALKLGKVTPELYIHLRSTYNNIDSEQQESMCIVDFRRLLFLTYLNNPAIKYDPRVLSYNRVNAFLFLIRREKRIALITPDLHELLIDEYIKLSPNEQESFSPQIFKSFLYHKYEQNIITYNAYDFPDIELKIFLQDALQVRDYVEVLYKIGYSTSSKLLKIYFNFTDIMSRKSVTSTSFKKILHAAWIDRYINLNPSNLRRRQLAWFLKNVRWNRQFLMCDS